MNLTRLALVALPVALPFSGCTVVELQQTTAQSGDDGVCEVRDDIIPQPGR